MSPGHERGVDSDIRIRTATASDVAVIHSLLVQLADDTGLSHQLRSTENDLLQYGFSDQPRFDVLLADQDGTVLGLCLFFYTFSSWRGEVGVYVQDLVVSREARVSGVGRRLLCETARQAKRRGATHLRLSVELDNETAIRFYRRVGLRASQSERIYSADRKAFLRLADAP